MGLQSLTLKLESDKEKIVQLHKNVKLMYFKWGQK